MKKLTALVLVASAFLCGFAGTSASAQIVRPVTYTIHLRLCPAGYSANDLFVTCHANGVANASIHYFQQGPEPGGDVVTDAAGDTSFTNEGGWIAGLRLDLPFEVIALPGYCTGTDTGTSISTITDLEGIAGDPTLSPHPAESVGSYEITCDWYLIPPASQTNPDPTATSTTGGVTNLPNTGTGPTSSDGTPIWPFAAISLIILAAGITTRRRQSS